MLYGAGEEGGRAAGDRNVLDGWRSEGEAGEEGACERHRWAFNYDERNIFDFA